jgi:hypothetical protein
MPSRFQTVPSCVALFTCSTLAFAQTAVPPAAEAATPLATTAPIAEPEPVAAVPPASGAARRADDVPTGKIVFNAPPAPIPNDGDSSRTFHYHDGFYTRFGINYGITGGGFAIGDGADQRRLDYSGSQLDIDLLIGGTPSDGIAIGGGLILGSLLQPDMEVGNQNTATRNIPVVLIGPFVDGFFSPSGGWHAGALLGLGGLGETAETEGSGGLGGAVWLGYDRWVGADWGIGGQLRFMGIAAGGDKPTDFSASAVGLGLGFSVLYH